MSTTKEQIIVLLKEVNRNGIDKLIDWLEMSDFFTAPASTKYHECTENGLARHSYNVYSLLEEKVKRFFPDGSIPEQSVKIIGLLHDCAKIGLYKMAPKWKKDEDGKWVQEMVYQVQETALETGHGEKSVFLIQRYMQLTDLEIICIRWHMLYSEVGVNFTPISFSFRAAINKYPLVVLTGTADMEASFVVEGRK